jgi:2,3-bisphosphoglycerate-independent phosphoglycerate mutase
MDILKDLIKKNEAKIVLIVLDGVGDLPGKDGKTPLEYAKTPNLDSLAKESATGFHIPVDLGITPGSGPGHLGLFGYDPKEIVIGRGVLEALGVGLTLTDRDIAARGNFATVRYEGDTPIVVDRRAGRIPTEENQRLIEKLKKEIREIDGVEVILKSGLEHRFSVVFRFPDEVSQESAQINDTDPQVVNLPPLPPKGENEPAERVARVAQKFIELCAKVLRDEERANYVLLRGFSVKPKLVPFSERFGVRALCIAYYPMYRGLASLVGMTLLDNVGGTIESAFLALKEHFSDYDFFFVHIKKTDSYGEDGNFEGKVKVIEEFDRELTRVLELKPDVLCITGDHSTPCPMKGHSWHPVPVLIHSPYVLGGLSQRFTERECLKGELGIFPAVKLMPLLLAHAGKLKKFGA